MTHVDTTFLIDLLREAKRGIAGPATKKLEELADEELALSLFVLCELEAGATAAAKPVEERRRVVSLTAPLALALPDAALAERYGELLAKLDRQGETVGTMDLLIAATALADGARLVTRNGRRFGRIPGLEVVSY